MEILETSGKACEGMAKSHDVTLALTVSDDDKASLNGYFSGNGISIGKISGRDRSHLDVHYPFNEELRASGHSLSISRFDETLVAELHDRHVDDSVDDCNFDRARFELTRMTEGSAADRLALMAGLFDAQLNRSQALALSQSSGYAVALPYFEKALSLAETYLPKGSEQINSYLIGVATSYIWLEQFDQFNQLFDTKIAPIADESVRTVFSAYRVRTLMREGRAALAREDFDSAMKSFEYAYKLQPQNSEVVIAVVSVELRRERYPEAIAFMERTEAAMINESDRKDLRSATAMILSKKAQRDDKEGKGSDAENALKRAIELDPGSVRYLIALARQHHKAGNLSGAEALLDQGLEQFKDELSRSELLAARDRIHQTELILKKIRKVGS
jgi:tetratricopeptide (TPR) repeat protein